MPEDPHEPEHPHGPDHEHDPSHAHPHRYERAAQLSSTVGRFVGENRWVATACTATAAVLQARLPEGLSLGPGWVVPALALPLTIALVALNPGRISAASRDLRALSIVLIAILSASNISSLALLLHSLLNGSSISGRRLIYSAVEIWFSGVILFGLWLWEMDRGGPIARARGEGGDPELLFPQMADASLCSKPWQPTLVDYLYVSLTNSTAFSPTDTLPLSVRVKALMAAESLTSLATIAVVGARAVNILK